MWKDLTDDPSSQKIVHCKDKMNVGKPFYISVSTFLNIFSFPYKHELAPTFSLILCNIIYRLLVKLKGYIMKKLTGKLWPAHCIS